MAGGNGDAGRSGARSREDFAQGWIARRPAQGGWGRGGVVGHLVHDASLAVPVGILLRVELVHHAGLLVSGGVTHA